jgi:hypothetical protein
MRFKQKMYFSVCCLISLLVMCLPDVGLAGPANVFEIESIGNDRLQLTFQLNAYDLTSGDDVFAASDVIYLDRSEERLAPAFARALEVGGGRYVVLDGMTVQKETMPRPDSVSWGLTGENVVTVQLARMGRRVHVRVEVKPFQPDSDGKTVTVYRSIKSTFLLTEKVPESKETIALAEPEIAPMGDEYTWCHTCPPAVPVGVAAGAGEPGDFAPHRSVTNDAAWKIRIDAAGLYRITGADLATAGVPEAYRNASQLRLASRDQAVPMWSSTDAALGDDDWLMFYGAAAQSAYGRHNVYWLSIGSGDVSPEQIDAVPTFTDEPITSAWTMVEYAPKNFYRAAYNPLEDSYDHWFAMEVAGATTSNIVFATPYPVSTGDVYLAYSLHGVNATDAANPDHRSVLRVGGSLADTREYDEQVSVSGTVSVPAASISHAGTLVSVEQQVPPGVPHPAFSNAYIEWLRLCYQRLLVAQSLPFFFSGPASPGTIRVSQIPTQPFWLLDVSNPLQPIELFNYEISADGAAWRMDFEDAVGGSRCFAIFDESSVQSVFSIDRVHFLNLAETNRQVDYLVVAPDLFREPVNRLLRHRSQNGLSVQVATPEDIYNEFSYGMTDPVGIRQYFGYAYHHYQTDEPRYALLVGSGSYDPFNHLGASATSHIPVHMGPTPWRRTAHEQWYATIDGDDLLPDITVGRIPAATIAEVVHAVDKLVAFETAATNAPWRETALLVADEKDVNLDFKAFTEANTRSHLVTGGFDPVFGIQTAYRDDFSQTVVKQTIQGVLDGDVHIVHFMGHGGVRQWASPSIWNVDNASAANNTVYPIVGVFTCQNGLFFDPEETSLVQAMLLNSGGASGMVAPSALSVQLFSEKLADGFYEALAVDRVERIGDAMQEGLLRLWSFNPNVAELRFYTIFGDPAQQIWTAASSSWDADYIDIGGGWRRLTWFGDYVPMSTSGWIWHNKHGFFYVSPSATPESIWLYAQDMGWLYTSNTIYPFLFSNSARAWLWYNEATDPRWFLNMTTGLWESRP